MALLVTKLLNDVRRTAALPESQERFSDDDLLEFVNEELKNNVYPFLLTLNEEYGLVKEIIPFLDSNGNEMFPTLTVPVPRRAYGRTIRELKFLDSSSNLVNIPYIELNDEDIFQFSNVGPLGFYFVSDGIQLYGEPGDYTSSLVAHYLVEPSEMVNKPTQFADITAMSYGAGTTSIAATSGANMDDYCASGDRKLFDIIRKSTGALLAVNIPMIRSSANMYSTTVLDQTDINAINAFQEGGFAGLVAPSYYDAEISIIPAGQSPFTCIPKEADQLLTWHVTSRVLSSLGDSENLAIAENRVTAYKKTITQVLGNRIQGEAKKITNRRGLKAYMVRVNNRSVRSS